MHGGALFPRRRKVSCETGDVSLLMQHVVFPVSVLSTVPYIGKNVLKLFWLRIRLCGKKTSHSTPARELDIKGSLWVADKAVNSAIHHSKMEPPMKMSTDSENRTKPVQNRELRTVQRSV